MRNVILASALFLVAAFTSLQANAAFVETNWKTSGDKLATLDTDTGLEWLDLSFTQSISLSTLQSYISATGHLAGWRLAKESEVKALMSRMFSTKTIIDGVVNIGGETVEKTAYTNGEGSNLNRFLGLSRYEGFFNGGTFHEWYASLGSYLDDSGLLRTAGSFAYMQRPNTVWHQLHFDTKDMATFYTSYFLVSDGGLTLSSVQNPSLNENNPSAPVNQIPDAPADVPVQAGFGLLGLLLIASGLRRRKSS